MIKTKLYNDIDNTNNLFNENITIKKKNTFRNKNKNNDDSSNLNIDSFETNSSNEKEKGIYSSFIIKKKFYNRKRKR